MTIWEIKESYKFALDNIVVNEDGEIENAEAIESLNADLEEKMENISLYIKNQEALKDALDNEIKALQSRKKSIDARCDYLKRMVANTMVETDKTKFETSKVALSFRRSSSVEVFDMEKLPACYTKSKYEVSADKMKIKEALKDGYEVPGAVLIEKSNLVIK